MINEFLASERTYIEDILASDPDYALVNVMFNEYQGVLTATRADDIIVFMSLPNWSKPLNNSCRLTTILVTQFKVRMCLKRNPNYELYYALLDTLHTQTNYQSYITSSIDIEKNVGTGVISASKLITIS